MKENIDIKPLLKKVQPYINFVRLSELSGVPCATINSYLYLDVKCRYQNALKIITAIEKVASTLYGFTSQFELQRP